MRNLLAEGDVDVDEALRRPEPRRSANDVSRVLLPPRDTPHPPLGYHVGFGSHLTTQAIGGDEVFSVFLLRKFFVQYPYGLIAGWL